VVSVELEWGMEFWDRFFNIERKKMREEFLEGKGQTNISANMEIFKIF
jgi:hypothetical protein